MTDRPDSEGKKIYEPPKEIPTFRDLDEETRKMLAEAILGAIVGKITIAQPSAKIIDSIEEHGSPIKWEIENDTNS